MTHHTLFVAVLLLASMWAQPALAQPGAPADPPSVSAAERVASSAWFSLADEAPAVYYVVDRRPELRAGPGAGAVLGRLDFRRGVFVRGESGPWRLVEDVETGERLGWVQSTALSNVWLLMDKPSRTLYLYRGAELVREFAADVSHNPVDNKVQRGGGVLDHYRIPEGSYFVTGRNPNSQYYRSFMLNYPNAEDASRGLAQGLISHAQYRAIVEASERFTSPPMRTRLGGAIAIHGQGSGRRRAWTRGCIALRDIHMDYLWDIIQVGTPIFIR